MLAMRRIIGFYTSAQFTRFLVVGGIALLVHWLSRLAFNIVMSYGWAIVLAYVVGMAVGFVLNKIYVFPCSVRSTQTEMIFFFFVNIAAFPLVWVLAYVMGEWFLIRYMPRDIALAIAHGVAITLPVFMNYALHKLVTFRGA
jgi:energy-coupling factor transport system substrate-specific component